MQYVIGKGGFGKVWKAKGKKSKKDYAIKQIYKPRVIDKKSEKGILFEKDLLSRIKHP